MNSALPSWLDPLLRDPETGARLERRDDGYVRGDGKYFPVRDGILSAVFPESLTGDDARWNRFYEWFAPFYDWTQRVGGRLISGSQETPEQLWRREVVDRLGLRPSARVLEVSPGPGIVQNLLRERIGDRGELVAVDLSRNMLRQCRRRGDRDAGLIHGNGGHLPFADDSFDAVLHFGGVNLFNEPARALAEFARVAKPGGVVAWGDEGFSASYPEGIKKRLLAWMNPGYQRARPAAPECVDGIASYEVFFGLAYLIVGKKKPSSKGKL